MKNSAKPWHNENMLQCKTNGRISDIKLLSGGHARTEASLVYRDKQIALRDLVENSVFEPVHDSNGPYMLSLSLNDQKLVFEIKNSGGKTLPVLILSLRPYLKLIKDYFLIVESYEKAVSEGQPSRIEAIDMGRRGLHNEGAALLLERLQDKIRMDQDTGRRLFTLICVLYAGTSLSLRQQA